MFNAAFCQKHILLVADLQMCTVYGHGVNDGLLFVVLPLRMMLFTKTFDIRLIGGVIESSVKSISSRHSPPRSPSLTTYIKRGSFDVISTKWRLTANRNQIISGTFCASIYWQAVWYCFANTLDTNMHKYS